MDHQTLSPQTYLRQRSCRDDLSAAVVGAGIAAADIAESDDCYHAASTHNHTPFSSLHHSKFHRNWILLRIWYVQLSSQIRLHWVVVCQDGAAMLAFDRLA